MRFNLGQSGEQIVFDYFGGERGALVPCGFALKSQFTVIGVDDAQACMSREVTIPQLMIAAARLSLRCEKPLDEV